MPEAAARRGTVKYVLIVVLLAGTLLCLHQWVEASRRPSAPEALWHNGVIVEVRNCEALESEEVALRCAALTCAQRVTEQLTNAQQTRLKITKYARDDQHGDITVIGTLEQALASPTLPTGFRCQGRDPGKARPELQYPTLPRAAP